VLRQCLIVFFLSLAVSGWAKEPVTSVFAAVDGSALAASGLKSERTVDGPDFKVRYFSEQRTICTLGIFEGGHPSLFSDGKKKLGEVVAEIAGQRARWLCWEESDPPYRYGAEVLVGSRRTQFEEWAYDEQIHLFIRAGDLRSLATARELAARILKEGPVKYSPPAADRTKATPKS